MKYKFIFLACALFLGVTAIFSAFDKPDAAQFDQMAQYDEDGSLNTVFAPSYGVVTKAWAKDTITNAANDTLELPGILASPYQYGYQVRITDISGTRNVKFYLEAVSHAKSTRWMKVDSMVTSGSTINDYHMKAANTYGIKHRVIVDGTGTQSTAYQLDALLKKTN